MLKHASLIPCQVVYVTAILPLFILAIMFFRGVHLKGFQDGLTLLFIPEVSKRIRSFIQCSNYLPSRSKNFVYRLICFFLCAPVLKHKIIRKTDPCDKRNRFDTSNCKQSKVQRPPVQ